MTYQPRYLAYCRAHHSTPKAMQKRDGKRMDAFSRWIGQQWGAFDKETDKAHRVGAGWSDEGHRMFDERLRRLYP